MKLIDTHTHAWGTDTDELPWKADVVPPGWEGPYTARNLIEDMDMVGVDESVIVTTPLYGRGIRANEYTMRAIEAFPDRFWGVAIMDFFSDEPEQIRADLRRVVGHDRMLGIRMHACMEYAEIPTELDRTADWILDDALEPVWEEAAALETAVFVFPKAEQLPMIAELAKRHPNVQLVVDHMAFPDETTVPDEDPWASFKGVADYDNVAVKVSSLPRSAENSWPYTDLHKYVRNLIDWFGPERLMLGSDYPWMDSWASYESSLSWIEEASFLSARDVSYLTHRSFEDIHNL